MTKNDNAYQTRLDLCHPRGHALRTDVFRLRIQKSMGQLDAALKLKSLRRDLARVKTALREKESV